MRKLTCEQVERYTKSIEKSFHAYATLQKEDGSFGLNHASYYNAFYMLYLAGDWTAARRLHAWTSKELVGGDGLHDIESTQDDCHGYWVKRGTYLKAWHVVGAHLCGFYDQSLKAADSLMRYVDVEHGGCYMDDDGRARRTLMCFSTSGSVGRALLAVGKRYEAYRVAEWMLKMIDEQPDLETGFYEYMDAHTGKIVTDANPVSPYYTKDDFDPDLFCYWNKTGPQGWAMFGPTTDFLAGMYQMTGDARYLDGMMKIFNLFYDNEAYGSLSFIASGKMLQGLPVLYLATGDERILDACVKLCDYLVSIQKPSGVWIGDSGSIEAYMATGLSREAAEYANLFELAAQTADEVISIMAVLKYLS